MSSERGFVCVKCGGPTLVSDRRGRMRRRKCVDCDHKFKTHELSDDELQDMQEQIANLSAYRDKVQELLREASV